MPITDDLIMAQCFMLFIAGYENTTVVLCAAIFELARHPEVQEKVYQEIRTVCGNDISDLTLNKLSKMPYLDMVVCGKFSIWSWTSSYFFKSIIRAGLKIVIIFDRNTPIVSSGDCDDSRMHRKLSNSWNRYPYRERITAGNSIRSNEH